MEIAMMREEI